MRAAIAPNEERKFRPSGDIRPPGSRAVSRLLERTFFVDGGGARAIRAFLHLPLK